MATARIHPVYIAQIDPEFILTEADLERLLQMIRRLNRGDPSVQRFPPGIRVFAAQAASLDPGWELSPDPSVQRPPKPMIAGARRIEFDDDE